MPKIVCSSLEDVDDIAQALNRKHYSELAPKEVAVKHDSKELPLLSFVSKALTGDTKYVEEFRLLMLRAMVKYRAEIEELR